MPYHRERYSEPKPAAGELADSDPRAIADFRKELERSGEFMVDEKYGTVWVPDPALVGDDFAPYVTHGRWALNENDDWVWMSDFSFGNIVFHYGRWVYVPEVGWAWIPGRKYAPAWVEWRVPDEPAEGETQIDYVGWAPTPPTFVWYGGVAYSYGYVPVSSWVYCPSPWVFAYPVWPYVVHDHGHAHHAWGHTHPYAPGAHAGQHGRGHGYVPVGPPLDRARVPDARRPTERVPVTDGAKPVAVRPVDGARVGAERGVADPRRIGQARPGTERAATPRGPAHAASPRYTGRVGLPRYTGALVPRDTALPARTYQGRVARPPSVVRVEPPRTPSVTRSPTRTIGVTRSPGVTRTIGVTRYTGVTRTLAPARGIAPMPAPTMRSAPVRSAPMRSVAPMRAPAMRGAAPMRAPAMRGAAPMRAPTMRSAAPTRGPAMHGAPMRGGMRGGGARGR